MKKRISVIFLALVLCLMTLVTAAGNERTSRLQDEAGLLDSSEADAVRAELDSVSEKNQVDIVVVTVDSLEGKTAAAYADDFYDENGYGFGIGRDGILLLVCMGSRDWYISTTGFGITAVTDAGIEYISQQFLPKLSDGEYAEAFTIFAQFCDEFAEQARNGNPYDTGNMPKKPFHAPKKLLISLIAGFLIAFLITGVMKSQLKSVRPKNAAGSYVREGSLNLTENRDIFLYSHVDRQEKPKENHAEGSSTHTSSSGTTHGGGGGKF